jgi:hypothetical protein
MDCTSPVLFLDVTDDYSTLPLARKTWLDLTCPNVSYREIIDLTDDFSFTNTLQNCIEIDTEEKEEEEEEEKEKEFSVNHEWKSNSYEPEDETGINMSMDTEDWEEVEFLCNRGLNVDVIQKTKDLIKTFQCYFVLFKMKKKQKYNEHFFDPTMVIIF